MKRYDQNAFIVFVLLCGLNLLYACSSTRNTNTTTTGETRDTTHTCIIADTTAATVEQHTEQHDTVRQADRVTGSLKIERDTAGRPVLYIWDTSALMQSTRSKKIDDTAGLSGYSTATATYATATRAENIEKEEKTATKIGPSLEEYIGAGLLVFVILYVLFVCIENLWRHRNK